MCRVLRAWVSITGTALIKRKRIIECQGNLLGCPMGPRWGFEARGTGRVSVFERRIVQSGSGWLGWGRSPRIPGPLQTKCRGALKGRDRGRNK